ncbi:hypothetical protein Tcan_00513, partial [Toxocara canis]
MQLTTVPGKRSLAAQLRLIALAITAGNKHSTDQNPKNLSGSSLLSLPSESSTSFPILNVNGASPSSALPPTKFKKKSGDVREDWPENELGGYFTVLNYFDDICDLKNMCNTAFRTAS